MGNLSAVIVQIREAEAEALMVTAAPGKCNLCRGTVFWSPPVLEPLLLPTTCFLLGLHHPFARPVGASVHWRMQLAECQSGLERRRLEPSLSL